MARESLVAAFWLLESTIIVYVLAINSIYFVLMLLGYFALRHCHLALTASEKRSLMYSSLVPSISVLVPAYNEDKTIHESVRATLAMNYPRHEVIVINDGSDDRTLRVLIKRFRLYRSSRTVDATLGSAPIKAVYESRDPIPLVVIDKENGGKADALNAGVSASRCDLVAVVDADSLLEPDALLSVVKPFLEDEQVVAAGGIVRVANGCTVEGGQVTGVRAPAAALPLFQAVEYLRAFLGGRVAFSFIDSLLVISGAFGLFDRSAVIEVGGFAPDTVGEDMELTVRMQQLQRNGMRARVVFVPDPVCWTETPVSLKVLYRQRNRWQRGTVETIARHRHLLFNRKYGALGWFGFPYFTLFEMFGPVVELLGYVVTVVGFLLGVVSVEVAYLFFMASVLFSIVLSMGAVMLEELTSRRYPSLRDVIRLFGAAVAENFGYRQLMTLWRAKGLLDGLAGKTGWGTMDRRGFDAG